MKTKVTALLFLASLTITFAQTKVSYIQTEKFAKAGLPFSQAVQIDNIIYLSGQIGGTETGLVPGGIGPETKQIMENMKAILEQNSSSMDKIIKCTCMLADIKEWSAMSTEYIKYFPTHKPARSAFATSGLAQGARVEIECMAYVK
jgi:2-iminobutanoate/2-iminopropanoate deaminase